MKKIFFFLLLINFAIISSAQDSWKVFFNKTECLKSNEENESKNIISITQASLNKGGELAITYIEDEPQKDWRRIISIFDKNDNELFKKENVRMLKIPNARVKNLFKNKSSLHIYTWALPNDPDLAARIRIRRVHLCTIELK